MVIRLDRILIVCDRCLYVAAFFVIIWCIIMVCFVGLADIIGLWGTVYCVICLCVWPGFVIMYVVLFGE